VAQTPVLIVSFDSAQAGGSCPDKADDECFGPDRAQGKPVPPACLATVDKGQNDKDTGNHGKNPAAGRAERAERSAADQGKGVVQRCDRFAPGDQKRRTAPDKQTAKRHDEGWNAKKGDQHTLKGADQRAHRNSEDHRDDPDRRVAHAKGGCKPFHLQQPHVHPDHPHDRADGQVDVPGDDDQNHPRRHDADIGCLDRKVPKVARRDEAVRIRLGGTKKHAGPAKNKGRISLESQPDQGKGTDHPQQPRVNFGRAQKPGDRTVFGTGGLGAMGWFGHVSSMKLEAAANR